MAARKTPLVLTVLVVTAALLAGCTGSGDGGGTANDGPAVQEESTESSASDATATPEPSTASDYFPTCDEVKAALGSAVADLIELPESENGVTTGSDGPALGCAWHTQETADSSIDFEEYGGIGVGISRDPEYTEESMEPLGWNVDDARVAAADAWALKVGGSYDPASQLDAAGVQVVRDGVVVVLTSGGVALQDVPQLAALTNEWALGAGVSVLDLMD